MLMFMVAHVDLVPAIVKIIMTYFTDALWVWVSCPRTSQHGHPRGPGDLRQLSYQLSYCHS